MVSEVQTKGRGRSGRTWRSPKGGLWFSAIIRPEIPVGQVPLLQFLFANALRTGIERLSGAQPEVKWPNDLVVNWKKLAGILIETKINNSHIVYAIIGVGFNVNLAAKELPVGATSTLIVTKKRFLLDRTLNSILTTMQEYYETRRDQESVLGDWWNHCAHRMKPVIIETRSSLVHGKCAGVNLDGSIIVETNNGKITVPDGTLRLGT